MAQHGNAMNEKLCRVSSVPVSSDLAEWVSRTWPLKIPVTCILWTAGINNVFMVDAAADRFVLRVSRLDVPARADPECETAALDHLARLGCPVARPIRTRQGNYVTRLQLPEGKVAVVLFERLDGDDHQPSPEESEQAGKTIARIHLVADSLLQPAAALQANAAYLLDAPVRCILERFSLDSQTRDRLEMCSEALRDRLQALPREPVSWGFIHGDALPTNTRRSSWFDFEFCGTGWRAYDVASWRCFARFVGWKGDPAEQSWESFLKGYTGVRPLAEWELRAIPLFVATRIVFVSGIHAWLADIRGHAMLGAQKLRARLDWLEELVRRL